MRWLPDEPQLALFGPEQRELPSVEYMAVNARRIINTLPASSRMPFRHTINVYRGCRHACTYCFARPTHEYLGLNSGASWRIPPGAATRSRWARTPTPTSRPRATTG